MAALSFDHNIFIEGPSFHVDLAPLDGRHLEHYSCRLLIFRCTDSAQRDAQLAAFKVGLQALVSQCPILGGKVVPLPPDQASHGKEDWRTIVPDKGIELLVRDLRGKIRSFEELEAGNFSTLHLPEELLMPIPQSPESPSAACKAQYTAIEGGTIISFTISHHLADGSGTDELMRILSEETRLAPNSNTTNQPRGQRKLGLDRSLLRDTTSYKPFNIEEHPAFRIESSTPATTETEVDRATRSFEASSPETPIILRIPPAGLALLKADATRPEAPPISTHDALSALIWRTVMLIRSRRSARDTPLSTASKIFMPSDCRRHLNLPTSYIGNAVYQLTADLDLEKLLSPSGLQYAASSLRRAITAVNPEIVASYMTKLKETWIGWGFMVGTSTIAVAMGTDWTSSSLYSDDWGEAFGKVVRFRYPGTIGEAFNCVYPKLPDGSAEVMVGVMPEEVDALKGPEGFGKYLEAR
ncbi:uncharacterized protein LY89DRAFT_687083 [Mollisia scopiformis]|uniref:BAHD acyltransferase n=1 Tax=Mollisia scopiformis TaxID=149040 RepID=A0A194X143_MOLSC|nr:uncharacterized protein LY89DRAFT_687083 [Mollisia scopiformis]KUJ13689.1 hypothetical protein LY89DRAFT_687083 [Mollisia scopiformis]